MQSYPPIPHVDDAPDILDGGHLWIQEQVDADLLRFAVDASGWIVFGDRDRVYRDDDVPVHLRHAVRHVRETIDREVVAASDLDDVVFLGAAMHRRAIDYDWERTPPFLGFDVHAPERGFLPPDVVERAFDRLSLRPVNAFEKEVPARHFDPGAYAFPTSNWYDGPPKGAIVRNKRGGRAAIPHPEFEPDRGEAAGTDPAAAAERFVTPERVERGIAALGEEGRAGDPDAVADRVVDLVIREAYGPVFLGTGAVDAEAVVREMEARARRLLLEERDRFEG